MFKGKSFTIIFCFESFLQPVESVNILNRKNCLWKQLNCVCQQMTLMLSSLII